MYDVACIGILVADAIAKTVNKLPEAGKLELVDRLDLYTGGCAANASIDMTRLGLKVAIIGKTGHDGFGKYLANSLKDENVNIDGLISDSKINTSASVLLVDETGERSILHSFGANAEFTEEDVNVDIINNSKIVFIAGTNLMPKFDGEPCAQILKKAKELGKYTVLDTAWDSTGKWMDVLRPCMPYIDLFIPSYDEAVALSGEKTPEAIADVFLSMGVKTAVIKMGKEGCFIKDSTGEVYMIPTYSKIKPVDTTGAGDSFVSGFITGLIQGWSLYDCGKFANAVGTHCVMAVGASSGIKSMEETLEFMKKYEEDQ